jgi:hypothetical protein
MTGAVKYHLPQPCRLELFPLLLVGAFFLSGIKVMAADEADLKAPSIWAHFIDLRTETGYRDNPTYASSNPSGSSYGTFKVEYTLARLPVDEWQVMILTSADATHFIDSDLTDHEILSFSLFQLQKETLPGRNWEAGFQHVYQDQIIDASSTVVNQGSVAIHGHTLVGYVRWKQQWSSGWWLALKPALEWQSVAAPLDGSYEPGLSIALGQDYGQRTAYSLTYDFQERVFDDTTATDVFGVALPGDALRFRQHQIEASYRRELDPSKVWRLTLRASWLHNEDNGQGYYDYNRCRMALDVRWRKKPWEIKLSSRASYYDYSIQTVAGAGSELRSKAVLLTGLQVRRDLKRGCYLVLRGEHEQSLSNLTTDRYVANLLSFGLGWEN